MGYALYDTPDCECTYMYSKARAILSNSLMKSSKMAEAMKHLTIQSYLIIQFSLSLLNRASQFDPLKQLIIIAVTVFLYIDNTFVRWSDP